ncbi:hypothetical protein TNCV_1431861 [Trichonephila clavipes]|nr:hypothetical protein TNCV_1431861 [Trichonephila clavipes]
MTHAQGIEEEKAAADRRARERRQTVENESRSGHPSTPTNKNISPSNVHLFPSLKVAFSGRNFQNDAEETIPCTGLGSNPRADMDVCKCIVPLRHGGTLYSRRAASSFNRAKSYCQLYDAQGYGQQQAYILPRAMMNFVGLDMTQSRSALALLRSAKIALRNCLEQIQKNYSVVLKFLIKSEGRKEGSFWVPSVPNECEYFTDHAEMIVFV